MVKKYYEGLGHESPVYGVSLYKNAQVLSAGGEGWIVAWSLNEPANGKLIAKVDTSVYSLFYDVETDIIYAGDRHGVLHSILPNGQTLDKMAHPGGVFGIFKSDQNIYTFGNNGTLTKWKIPEMLPVESVQICHASIRSFVVDKQNNDMYFGASDGKIYCVDMLFLIVKFEFQAHKGTVFSLEMNDAQQLISGGKDALLKVWNFNKFEQPAEEINAHWFAIYAMKQNPCLPIIASASRDKNIRLWQSESLAPILTIDLQAFAGHSRSVNNLIWTKDGKMLITVGDDKKIILWQIESHL